MLVCKGRIQGPDYVSNDDQLSSILARGGRVQAVLRIRIHPTIVGPPDPNPDLRI